MRNSSTILLVATLWALLLSVTNCKKEKDSEIPEKEAMTLLLNDDISADSLQSLVTWLQDMGTRFTLTDDHRNVALSIKNRFLRFGYTNATIDSFWVDRVYQNINYGQWQYNVTATLEGSSMPDSISVMGAHYDDYSGSGDPFVIAPGANDNASGVAAALEVARVMKKNNYRPAGTIMFVAFGAEELGLYGSSAFVTEAVSTGKKIRFMLNNDMIAYQPDNNKANWSVDIMDYDNSHFLRTEAEKLCSKYTALQFFNDNTHNNASDSYPFFAAGFKPLFFFSQTIDPNYHTAEDLASNCNFEYSREIVMLNCAVLVDKN